MEQIPRVALGTVYLNTPCDDIILYAFEEAGYKHIDCAEMYENEDEIGKSLAKLFERGKVKREDIWITSKVWNTHHKPGDAERCCRRTLERLQVDYLDLYLVHWPAAFDSPSDDVLIPRGEDGKVKVDRSLKVIDLWVEMQHLVEIGLVKRIGVSNFSIEMLEKMRFDERVKIQPYCNQVEYNLYMQQEAMRMYCEFRGIYMEGYSTLGTGKWEENGNPCLLSDPVLCDIAKEVGKMPAAVELKFLLAISDKTVVLAKSNTPERLKANNSLDFELTDDQIAKLKARERCFRFIDPVKTWGYDIFGDGW